MKKIYIDMDKCPRCGKIFKDEVVKTRHHAVPQFMKPEYEVLIPLCKPCHEELNGFYSHSNKKPTFPGKNKIKTIYNHAEGLKGTLSKYEKKLDKFMDEVKNILGDGETDKKETLGMKDAGGNEV